MKGTSTLVPPDLAILLEHLAFGEEAFDNVRLVLHSNAPQRFELLVQVEEAFGVLATARLGRSVRSRLVKDGRSGCSTWSALLVHSNRLGRRSDGIRPVLDVEMGDSPLSDCLNAGLVRIRHRKAGIVKHS